MSDAVFDRLTIPYGSPASVFTRPDANSENSSISTITAEQGIKESKPIEIEKPKRPKPLSQMNKTELKDEYRNLTGLAPINMNKKDLLKAIKAYKFSSPNKR